MLYDKMVLILSQGNLRFSILISNSSPSLNPCSQLLNTSEACLLERGHLEMIYRLASLIIYIMEINEKVVPMKTVGVICNGIAEGCMLKMQVESATG